MNRGLFSSTATLIRDREFTLFAAATCFVSSTMFHLPGLLPFVGGLLPEDSWAVVWIVPWIPAAVVILRLGDPARTRGTAWLLVIAVTGTLCTFYLSLGALGLFETLLEDLARWWDGSLDSVAGYDRLEALERLLGKLSIGIYLVVLAISVLVVVRRLRFRRA